MAVKMASRLGVVVRKYMSVFANIHIYSIDNGISVSCISTLMTC